MAEVLGIPLSGLALEVETKLRLGWTEGKEEGQLTLLVTPSQTDQLKNRPEKDQKTYTGGSIQPPNDGTEFKT